MKTVKLNDEVFRIVTDVTGLRFTNIILAKGSLILIYTQDYLKGVYDYERVVLRVKM